MMWAVWKIVTPPPSSASTRLVTALAPPKISNPSEGILWNLSLKLTNLLKENLSGNTSLEPILLMIPCLNKSFSCCHLQFHLYILIEALWWLWSQNGSCVELWGSWRVEVIYFRVWSCQMRWTILNITQARFFQPKLFQIFYWTKTHYFQSVLPVQL